jgi:hypothetical protein
MLDFEDLVTRFFVIIYLNLINKNLRWYKKQTKPQKSKIA